MTRLYRLAGLITLALMLVACAGNSPVPEDRFYHLQVNIDVQPLESPVFAHGLMLDSITADPLRSGRAVLYRDLAKPLQLQRYHYEYWVDQPPRLVRQALLNSLRESGMADVVYAGGRHARARYRMTGRVLRFEKVLKNNQADAEFELEISVLEEDSDVPLWTKVYLQRQRSQDRSMHAAAEAMQQALASVIQQLLGDLKALDVTP